MDAFSEILSGVKLEGALYFNAEFSAPWGVANPSSPELAPTIAPGAQRLIIYHYVIGGRAFAHLGSNHIPLGPGDIVVLPHGDSHIMSSESVIAGTPETREVDQKIVSREFSLLRAGGGGETTRFICGYMACDPELSRPVLSGLPPMFKVNIRSDQAGEWLENSIVRLVDEAASGSVGSKAMLAKLSEALFVDTLRRYVMTMPESNRGWLAGARDPVVGKSLALLHRRVQEPWTIEHLAEEVGVSRSALVERFTRLLSEPPITYLTRWRLQLAARALLGTPKGVAEIAAEVGYESEAAFNRAFKREFKLPPARYRREYRLAASASSA